MSTEPLPASENGSKRPPRARPWLIAPVAVAAALIAWGVWPSSQAISSYDLSRDDGKSRFYATAYPKMQTPPTPPNLTLPQRLLWSWAQLQRRYQKPNPAAFSFPASPVQPCS